MAYDVIVISAGLAGLLGGPRLDESGRRVPLLAKGHGVTHRANGVIGVARGDDPRAGITALTTAPAHPYARIALTTIGATQSLALWDSETSHWQIAHGSGVPSKHPIEIPRDAYRAGGNIASDAEAR